MSTVLGPMYLRLLGLILD